MRLSKVLIVTAALVLGAAMSVVPLQVAGAQSPSTTVLVPSNGATVSGPGVILDASASSGVTKVQFELTGGSLTDSVIATATPTYYGWIAKWNSTALGDGTYSLQSIATEGGSSATSSGISITVSNGNPSASLVVPSSGETVSGKHAVLDALASPGVSEVYFEIAAPGCPEVSPPYSFPPIYLCTIGTVPTLYGWIGTFDATEWANGTRTLFIVAQYPSGQGSTNTSYSFKVDNQAQPTVVVPANNSTVSGTQVLDCVPPPNTEAPVAFDYTGLGVPPQQLGVATLTDYGWIYDWNTTGVTNEQYSVSCNATFIYGGGENGPAISITVSN